jgi:hypothetical protein
MTNSIHSARPAALLHSVRKGSAFPISFLIIGGYASAEGAASPSMIDEKAKPFHTEGGKAASFEA